MMLVSSSNLWSKCRTLSDQSEEVSWNVARNRTTPTFYLWRCAPLSWCPPHHRWEAGTCGGGGTIGEAHNKSLKSWPTLRCFVSVLYWRLERRPGGFGGDLICRRGGLWLAIRAGGKETRHCWKKMWICRNKRFMWEAEKKQGKAQLWNVFYVLWKFCFVHSFFCVYQNYEIQPFVMLDKSQKVENNIFIICFA